MAECYINSHPWALLPLARVSNNFLRMAVDGDIYAVPCFDVIPTGFSSLTEWRTSLNGNIYYLNTLREPETDIFVASFLEVEFSGLGGDWSTYNGVHILGYEDAYNTWHKDLDTGSIVWVSDSGAPYVRLSTRLDCLKDWENLSASLSDPEGAYSEKACTDSGCYDGDSCYKSSGATCKVRYYGATWP